MFNMVYRRSSRYGRRRFPKRRFTSKSKRFGRGSFKSRVHRAVLSTSETKYFDIGLENVQLYHNTGVNTGAYVTPIAFNYWELIASGGLRQNRIGDKITPVGTKIKLWLANKLDRPNINYRIVVCSMPKMYNGAVVSSGSIDPLPPMQSGSLGNYLNVPWDKEKGIRVLYDKVVRVEAGSSGTAAGVNKEYHREVSMWIKNKKGRPLVFNGLNKVVNNPMAIYIIPYDSFGSLVADNIASCAAFIRLYFKDI